MGQDHMYGETTNKAEKKGRIHERVTVLGINASRCSHSTGLRLSASLPPRGPPSLGLLETPQVGVYLVIIPIFQHEHGGREAGSPGELTAGHTDQAKSQWAAGDVAAGISFQSTAPPRLPALHLACFLNTSVEQERTEPARTKVMCTTLA